MAFPNIDTRRPSKAVITINFLITVPIDEKSWAPINVDFDSFSVELTGYNPQDLLLQIRNKIEEFKNIWGTQIVSLENLPTDAETSQSKTEEL